MGPVIERQTGADMINMDFRFAARTLFFTLILFSYGCAGASSSPAPATARLSPTAIDPRETYQAQTQTAADQAATAEVEQLALATANAKATLDVQATETTIFKATQRIQNIYATSTHIALRKQSLEETETARLAQMGTAQALPLHTLLQTMEAEGLITGSRSRFTALGDFDESWAQINWFKYWRIGLYLENFAMRTKASWSIASEKANYFTSGCGIVFNVQDADNYHVVFLTMDGNASLFRNYRGTLKLLKRNYVGQVSIPQGQAEYALVVQNSQVFFYVDGQKVIQAYDSTIRGGDIGFTLMSGTNKGFGTRCQMQEAGYWELE